jgi:hypothetical protein
MKNAASPPGAAPFFVHRGGRDACPGRQNFLHREAAKRTAGKGAKNDNGMIVRMTSETAVARCSRPGAALFAPCRFPSFAPSR